MFCAEVNDGSIKCFYFISITVGGVGDSISVSDLIPGFILIKCHKTYGNIIHSCLLLKIKGTVRTKKEGISIHI